MVLVLAVLLLTILQQGSQAALPPAFVPPPILMYHRVDSDRPADRVGRELTVTPAAFAQQLAYLKERGIAGISMAQFIDRLRTGAPLDKVVVITFDDGYSDQYDDALPILRRYGDSATFFVVTGALDKPRHLTWAQLEVMRRLGEDIDAHGVEHYDLSKMTSAQQAYQIDDSVEALRRRLHVPVESYCYPSGRFNRATLPLLRGAGIDLAVTTDSVYVIAPQNRYELTRIRVRSDWPLAAFEAALKRRLEDGTVVRR